MELNQLTAICPIDGRYGNKNTELRTYFSEYGLIKYRIIVEIEWLKALANCEQIKEVPHLNEHTQKIFTDICTNFSLADAERVKSLEATTNHDVKAVEYFIKEKLSKHPELTNITEFVHFACTSEDINNLAYALMIKEARDQILIPMLTNITDTLKDFAHTFAEVPMMSRTHGQAATPTTLGKEFANFVYRLEHQVKTITHQQIRGKINGAVGNFNAHLAAYPKVNWLNISQTLVESLGLHWNPYTAQIENHDYIADLFSSFTHFNRIIVDLCRDIWGYVSLAYFKQKMVPGEIGSSTMPHKVNPIDFENAEGNALMANNILIFLSQQLLTSRWQRDLVDSTLMRNVGLGLGYSLTAYKSLMKGLNKLEINQVTISEDLEQHWELLAEPIQTVMRRYGVSGAYEQLKDLTRGQNMTQATIHTFVQQLNIPEEAKRQLLALTPSLYTGNAAEMAKRL